ncbi:MAG: response regulator transcription factor [Prevotella sp.]|nr:response regulator transcription factor [Prevotella sp.]
MYDMPKIAIINPNTLAVLGLKYILQDVMPIAQVDTFGSFAELDANEPDSYFHYFVSMDILLPNRDFFCRRRNKTIVLTLSLDTSQPGGFHCLCINVPEKQLIKSLLTLVQSAHAHGRNLPATTNNRQTTDNGTRKSLTERETEVMALIVRGFINKEIADRLNISLTTVVTHRKNVMDKLGLKSVSALTIYAVMNGYVDINKI